MVLLAFGPALAETAMAAGPEPMEDLRMAQARDCFQNNGGPQSCPTVFGWCSAQWGQERREACANQLYRDWDDVLNGEWQKLKTFAEGSGMRDRIDGETPVWDRLLAEQRVWIMWRDANCGWLMPAPEGEARSPGEARLDCLTHMTRARAQQLWDITYYMLTTDPP